MKTNALKGFVIGFALGFILLHSGCEPRTFHELRYFVANFFGAAKIEIRVSTEFLRRPFPEAGIHYVDEKRLSIWEVPMD